MISPTQSADLGQASFIRLDWDIGSIGHVHLTILLAELLIFFRCVSIFNGPIYFPCQDIIDSDCKNPILTYTDWNGIKQCLSQWFSCIYVICICACIYACTLACICTNAYSCWEISSFSVKLVRINLTPQLISNPTPPEEIIASSSSMSKAGTLPIRNPYPEYTSGMASG